MRLLMRVMWTKEEAATEDTEAEGKADTEAGTLEVKTDARKEEGKGTKRKVDEKLPLEVKENEPEIAESLVYLDWHNSDPNLRITDDHRSGNPFSRYVWGYCHAGAGVTYGFNTGKTWFEVKYLDNMDIKGEGKTTHMGVFKEYQGRRHRNLHRL